MINFVTTKYILWKFNLTSSTHIRSR